MLRKVSGEVKKTVSTGIKFSILKTVFPKKYTFLHGKLSFKGRNYSISKTVFHKKKLCYIKNSHSLEDIFK